MRIRSSADGRCHTWPARWLHLLGGGLFRRWTGHLLRARVRIHRTHADRHGPYVFAGNHRSFGDPPFIGAWCDQPLAYFARASLWKLPVIGWTLSIFQSVPVDRSRPGAGASLAAIDRLKQGISIVVFPEGTRTKDGRLQRLREGPALFARKAGVPVVPVYVHRTERWWPRGCPVPLRASTSRVCSQITTPNANPVTSAKGRAPTTMPYNTRSHHRGRSRPARLAGPTATAKTLNRPNQASQSRGWRAITQCQGG